MKTSLRPGNLSRSSNLCLFKIDPSFLLKELVYGTKITGCMLENIYWWKPRSLRTFLLRGGLQVNNRYLLHQEYKSATENAMEPLLLYRQTVCPDRTPPRPLRRVFPGSDLGEPENSKFQLNTAFGSTLSLITGLERALGLITRKRLHYIPY